VVLDSTPISLLTTTFGPWHISTYMSFKDLETQGVIQTGFKKERKKRSLEWLRFNPLSA
jgi:hypothetical protein